MKTSSLSLSVALAAAAAFSVLAFSSRPAASAPKEYKPGAVKDGGTIRGICRIKNPVELPKVEVFKDNEKGCGEKQRASERLVYDAATNGLGNCLVWMKGIAAGKEWPEAMAKEDRTASIDQKACHYVPHVQWVRPGTQMVILNSDAAEHNIHGYKNTMAETQFNFASPPGKTIDDVENAFLEMPAIYLVKCDIHPWMSAYVHVVEHPYHAVTSEKSEGDRKPGEFVLKDVPPGEYEVVAWHEGMLETPQMVGGKIQTYTYSKDVTLPAVKVKVEAGKDAAYLEFDFPMQSK
jgi:plastocyanin